MSDKISASLEAIAFQLKSEYPKRLTSLFTQAIANHENLNEVDRILNEVRSLTYETIGIDMAPEFVKGNALMPYRITCTIPNLTAFNVLNRDAVNLMKELDFSRFKPENVIEGKVDLKNAEVTGFFKTFKHKIQFSPNLFNGILDGDELCSIYLHEVGHAFTMMEYMGQTLITNTILAEVVGQLDPNDSSIRRYEIGKCAKLMSGSDDAITEDPSIEEITAVVLKGQVTRMQNRIGSRWYDKRLAEAVADQFAARWMKGASLVKAISKIERTKGVLASTGFDPVWVGLLGNFMTIYYLPFKTLSKSPIAFSLQFLKKYSANFAFSSFMQTLMLGLGVAGSDVPKDRMLAIRRETVTLLKDRTLSDDVRRDALADLKVIDEEIDNIHPFGDILNKLSRFIYQSAIGRRSELGQQKTIENLANNRLYELSATLKG